MIIHLTDKLRISSDSKGFALEKLRVNKGKVNWIAYRYYTTFQNAYKAIPTQLLKEADVTGYRDITTALQSLEEALRTKMESVSD